MTDHTGLRLHSTDPVHSIVHIEHRLRYDLPTSPEERELQIEGEDERTRTAPFLFHLISVPTDPESLDEAPEAGTAALVLCGQLAPDVPGGADLPVTILLPPAGPASG